MSTYCETPADYTDPGQYMEVPQGPPAYGDSPADDGGAVAQSGNSGDGLAAETPADSTADNNAEDLVTVTAVPHHTRYLRVANITGGKLKLYLQYYTEDENGDWDWSPVTLEKDSDAFAVDLDPSEATDIMDGEWRVNASKVRIWAKSDDGKEWNKFKTVDLDLVPKRTPPAHPLILPTTKKPSASRLNSFAESPGPRIPQVLRTSAAAGDRRRVQALEHFIYSNPPADRSDGTELPFRALICGQINSPCNRCLSLGTISGGSMDASASKRQRWAGPQLFGGH